MSSKLGNLLMAAICLLCLATSQGLAASSDLRGDMRLIEAVKNGTAADVRALLDRHSDVNAAEPDGSTALAWAVERDDLETADLLIRAGANLNAAND